MAKNFLTPIDLNNNEVRNFLLHLLATDPTIRQKARIWFNTSDNRAKIDDGITVKTFAFTDDIAPDSNKLGGTAAASYALREWVMQNFPDNGMLGEGGGIATLGEDGKVPSTQLPDYLLGQLLYGGTIVNNVATVSQRFKDRFGYEGTTLTITASNATSYEGVYFIARGANSVIADNTVAGDWVVSDGINWNKIDNTDAVVSVAGLTGTITVEQLSNKLGLDDFVTSTEFQDIADIANSALQSGESGQVSYLTVSKSGTKLTITPIIGLIGSSDGLALTSDIEEKVIGQNGDTATDLTLYGVKAFANQIKESDVFKFAITQLSTDNETLLWFDTHEGDDHHFVLQGVDTLLDKVWDIAYEAWDEKFADEIHTAFDHQSFTDRLTDYLWDHNYVDKDFLSEYVTGQLVSRPKKFVKTLDAQDLGWLQNRTHNIQHNLGTKSISVTIINEETDVVYADVQIVDENNIRVIFGNTLQQLSYVDVVVIG